MKLSKKDEEIILSSDHQFIEIDGIEYFCKYVEGGGIELVANKLARLISINCSKDYLVNINGELYYLSYSFYNLGNFKRGDEFNVKNSLKSNSLYNLWLSFEDEYPDECEKLMYDLIKVFIFDIFLLNGDRHLGNFIVLNENEKHKLFIYDNDNVFEDAFRVLLNAKMNSDDRLEKYSSISLGGNTTLSMEKNIEILEYFLATSSKEFSNLVVDIYNKLTPEVVEAVFSEVEKEENITFDEKEYNMKLYRENYRMITELLVERGLIDGQRIH